MTRWLICLNRRTYREYLRNYTCACWFGSHNMRPFECESKHPLWNRLGEDIAAYGLHEELFPVTCVSKSFVVHIHRTISIMLAEIQYMTGLIIPFLSSPITNFQCHLLSAHTTFLPLASCVPLWQIKHGSHNWTGRRSDVFNEQRRIQKPGGGRSVGVPHLYETPLLRVVSLPSPVPSPNLGS